MPDEEFARRCDEFNVLEYPLAEMPARTVLGVAAKLRRFKYYVDNGSETPFQEDLIATSIEALERLGRVS